LTITATFAIALVLKDRIFKVARKLMITMALIFVPLVMI
jgi:hypothetical protein